MVVARSLIDAVANQCRLRSIWENWVRVFPRRGGRSRGIQFPAVPPATSDVRPILVVEDDDDISTLVALHLKTNGWTVVVIRTGAEALAQTRIQTFSLIVLDLMLPDLDGLEICQTLRSAHDYTPILMLTARGTEHDRVLGFELGADDYLVKPFSVRELTGRVRALLRRTEGLRATPASSGPAVVRSGGLVLDLERRSATLHDVALSVTSREFDLLLQFVRHPERPFRRSQLLDLVWGYGHGKYGHTVNSLINRLRAKIEHDPDKPTCIVTVWGVGYAFVPPPEHPAEPRLT